MSKQTSAHEKGIDWVQVGEMVTRQPISFSDSAAKNAAEMRGRVVWVHPQGRYHTVEFGAGRTVVRESFLGAKR